MADDGGEEAPAEEQKPVMPSMPTKIEPPEYIAIQESLIPFFEDITDEQRDRRKFDEQRVEETNLYAQRIEEKLNDEIIKRKEADSALDKLAQTRLDTVQEALTHENGMTVLGFKFKIVDDEDVQYNHFIQWFTNIALTEANINGNDLC